MVAKQSKYYEAKDEMMTQTITIATKNGLTHSQIALLLNECQSEFIQYYLNQEKNKHSK